MFRPERARGSLAVERAEESLQDVLLVMQSTQSAGAINRNQFTFETVLCLQGAATSACLQARKAP